MGALVSIERTAQIMPHADLALNNVRTALSALQQQTSVHPSVGQAMEAVASSLGLIHNVWRAGQAPAPQAAFPAPVAAPAPAPVYAQPAPVQPARPQPVPTQQRAYENAATVAAPAGQIPFPAAAPAPAAPPVGNVAAINAELGTQSATNFYKGLSGNDIVDHGGLFVSTYMVPKLGANVRLKVSLPGGYEFEANAVVAWSREASDAGGDGAPPGFGAKFTQITQEARQLIYRYVRNREPLFHDDL
jgi:Tfp pilus assembly protein PilZ